MAPSLFEFALHSRDENKGRGSERAQYVTSPAELVFKQKWNQVNGVSCVDMLLRMDVRESRRT
jgi:hypothetical protein